MFSISFASKQSVRARVHGFGLIELLVSVSIIMVVFSIVLARQDAFNGAVLLRNQAFDIALGIREAQLSAVSVQGDSGGFREVVGVYFTSDTANNQQYIIFQDTNTNGFYDSGTDRVMGTPQAIDGRFEVRDMRVVGDAFAGDELTIIFVRPNYDARFFSAAGAANELAATSIEIDIARVGTTIDVTDPGTVRTIEITAAGQIAVQ